MYTWITHNIKYDVDSFFKGRFPSMRPEDVLLRGSAVCGGYARLYRELIKKMGLQCKIINGYSKGYRWNGTISSKAYHAWNAVKISDFWYYVDSTWGAGNINKEKVFVQEFTDFYFLCPEIVFFYSHYPDDEIWLPDVWKSKSPSLGFKAWSKLLEFTPEFIKFGLFNEHFRRFECFDNYTTFDSMVDLYFLKSRENLPRLDFTYEMYNAQDINVPNSVMIADEIGHIRISIVFPTRGKYKLEVYGKSSEHDGPYSHLFSMKLDAHGPGSNQIYPTVYPPFHQHFLPFKTNGTFITSNSNINVSFPKLPESNERLLYTYNLQDANNKKVPNSAMIVDEPEQIMMSILFPAPGRYLLDVYGKEAKRNGSYPRLFSLTLRNMGSGTNKIYPNVYPSFYKYFLPFETSGKFTSSSSMIHFSYPKIAGTNESIEYAYILYNEANKKVPNAVMIADDNYQVIISVIFPTPGTFTLDIYGKPTSHKGLFPRLFSVKLKNTGRGSNNIYPTVFSSFHKYFLPFYGGNFTTSDSKLNIFFPKTPSVMKSLEYAYNLYDFDNKKVPDATMIVDRIKGVEMNIYFPNPGEYTLDVYVKEANHKGGFPQLFSLRLKNTGLGTQETCPTVFSSFLKYFKPLDSCGIFTTTESFINIEFTKMSEAVKNLEYTFNLQKFDNAKAPNSVMVVDENKKAIISIIFPSQGEYILDLFGKVAGHNGSYPQLLSLKLKNTGFGSNITFPAIFPLFRENFLPFESYGEYTTSNSMINFFFPKIPKLAEGLEYTYHMFNIQNIEIPNSVMISDENNGVNVSVIFPSRGDYKLDAYGKIANNQGLYSPLFSLKLKNTGVGSNNIYPSVSPLFYNYFSPFECSGEYVTFDSLINFTFPKLAQMCQPLAFTYNLYHKDGEKVPNSVFITDNTNDVLVSIFLPTKGDYKLDVFGKEAYNKNSSYPYLFSMSIKNVGDGSISKFPTIYPSFYDKKGVQIFFTRQ